MRFGGGVMERMCLDAGDTTPDDIFGRNDRSLIGDYEYGVRMDQVSNAEQHKGNKRLLAWFIGLVALVLLGVALGWFDNTTELTPDHEAVLPGCFVLACLGGLISALVPVRDWKKGAVGSRVAIAFALALMGFIAVFLVSSSAADIVEGSIDFPAGRTTSHQALLLISRAYQTHGKGRSWNIQTMPIWSNLDITEDDYDFMLAHWRPGDNARNPDEISSHGYFCALVTIEQSGDAIRVMNAGSHRLPKGTVILCPSSARISR